MDELEYRFQEWLSCPACDADEDVGILAHGTDIVIECYGCNVTSEYTIGDDVPVTNLDVEQIERAAEDG